MSHRFTISLLHPLAIVRCIAFLSTRSLSFSSLAIRVNHIITQEILSQRVFSTVVASLKWLPSVFDDKSDGILAGFSDGVIRYMKLRSGVKPNGTEKKFELDLRLIQALKPHTKPVTFITIEVKNQWIATGVRSRSRTVNKKFLFDFFV